MSYVIVTTPGPISANPLRWHIRQRPELRHAATRVWLFDSAGEYEGTEELDYRQPLTRGSFPEEMRGSRRRFDQAIGRIFYPYRHGLSSESLLLNLGFEAFETYGSGNLPRYWEYNPAQPPGEPGPFGFTTINVKEGAYALTIDADTSLAAWAFQSGSEISVQPEEEPRLAIKMNARIMPNAEVELDPFGSPFYELNYAVRVGVNWLQDDGSWANTGESIDWQPFGSDFDGEGRKRVRPGGWYLQDILTAPIPASGTIRVYLSNPIDDSAGGDQILMAVWDALSFQVQEAAVPDDLVRTIFSGELSPRSTGIEITLPDRVTGDGPSGGHAARITTPTGLTDMWTRKGADPADDMNYNVMLISELMRMFFRPIEVLTLNTDGFVRPSKVPVFRDKHYDMVGLVLNDSRNAGMSLSLHEIVYGSPTVVFKQFFETSAGAGAATIPSGSSGTGIIISGTPLSPTIGLDLSKPLPLPRFTTAQRNGLSFSGPGLIVNTTTGTLQLFYDGTWCDLVCVPESDPEYGS